MPIPIKFGTKEETLPLAEDAAEDTKPETITVDNIINNPYPPGLAAQRTIETTMVLQSCTPCNLKNLYSTYTSM